MEKRRYGEWGMVPKRKPRFFKIGASWYYDTREGQTRGPFAMLPEAEMDARTYAEDQRDEVGKDSGSRAG